MTADANIETIESTALVDRVRALRQQGHRLVQLSASRIADSIEVTYSFELDSRLTNLRFLTPFADPRVPSICSVFPCVLLYENEIHDLFGVNVDGMAVDFHGKLYQTAVKFPLGSTKIACAKPAEPAPAKSAVPAAPEKTPTDQKAVPGGKA